VLDVPVCTGTGNEVLAQGDVLDAMYESSDFAKTWTKVMTATSCGCRSGSALQIGILGYGPRIQSCTTLDAVDPTATDPLTKLPTRIVFGLEEIWRTPADAGDGAHAVEGDRPLLNACPAGHLRRQLRRRSPWWTTTQPGPTRRDVRSYGAGG